MKKEQKQEWDANTEYISLHALCMTAGPREGQGGRREGGGKEEGGGGGGRASKLACTRLHCGYMHHSTAPPTLSGTRPLPRGQRSQTPYQQGFNL